MQVARILERSLLPGAIVVAILGYALVLYFFSLLPKMPVPTLPQGAATDKEFAQSTELLNRYTRIRRGDDLADLLYKEENFDALEKGLAESLAKIGTGEGSFHYTRTLGVVAADANVREEEEFEALIERWIAKYPDSHYPYLVRGNFYINVAWYYRGTSLARDVERKNMNAFHRSLQKARTNLLQAQAMNPNDPESSRDLISVATGLSEPRAQMEKYYRAAISACEHHLGARMSKLSYLMPRWHGSDAELSNFAKECDEAGEEFPILGIASIIHRVDLFRFRKANQRDWGVDSAVWLGLKRAFERAIESMEDPLALRSYFCMVAYRAGHMESAAEQFKFLGERWVPFGHWNGLQDYHMSRALCYSKLAMSLPREESGPLLKEAVELNATTHEPYVRYGHFLLEGEEYEEAETLLLRALEFEPVDAHAHFDLCQLYEHQERYEEALKYATHLHEETIWSKHRLTSRALIRRYKTLIAGGRVVPLDLSKSHAQMGYHP